MTSQPRHFPNPPAGTSVPTELVWRPQQPTDRDQFAVVDLHDVTLRLHTSVAVPASEPHTVFLPASGVMHARGWLPRGIAFESSFVVDPSAGPVVLCPLAPLAAPVPGIGPATWMVPWVRRADGWLPAAGIGPVSGPHVPPTPVPAAADEAVAVQLGDSDGPVVTVVVPASTRLSPLGQPLASPDDELACRAWSLLQYLNAGDLHAAKVIGGEILIRRGGRPAVGHFAADLALGYLQAATGDDRAGGQPTRLRDRYPWSADALVLSAWFRLGRQRPDRRLVRDLLAAVRAGGPAVARGLRLLADSLATCATIQDTPALRHALRRVGAIQRTMVPNVLTTYAALTPNVPLPRRTWQTVAHDDDGVGLRLQPTLARPRRGAWVWGPAARLLGGDLDGPDPRRSRPLLRRAGLRLLGLPPQAPVRQLAALERLAGEAAAQTPLSHRTVLGLRRSYLTILRSPADEPRPSRLWQPAPAPDGAWPLPRFALDAARLASRHDVRPSTTHRNPDFGCTVSLTHTAQHRIDAHFELDQRSAAPVVLVETQVASPGLDEVVLVPIGADRTGAIHLDSVQHWVQVNVLRLRTADDLGPADAEAIAASVPLGDRDGRNAWRAIARGRTDADPVAYAVRQGFIAYGETV